MRDDLDPRIVTLLDKHREGGRVVARMPKVRAVFDKGRYIPPSISRIIQMVARCADISPDAISGEGRIPRLVNARFCVANLAMAAKPTPTYRAINDAMLRGVGMAEWYVGRHADRLRQDPDYRVLFDRCLAELHKAGSP